MPTAWTEFLKPIPILAKSPMSRKVSADSSRTLRIGTRASGDAVVRGQHLFFIECGVRRLKPIPGSTLRVAPE